MKKISYSLKNNLLKTAQALADQGFSVLPVCGDSNPQYPKKPAATWTEFQHRIASKREIASWFNDDITAIGIICGQLSRLLVLDFDDHFAYQTFVKAFPTYANTFTVKTRRGYHLYFQTLQSVPTYQFAEGDIKGEKSYVIAPPSKITGHTYFITKDAPQVSLLPHDIDEILNFFHIKQYTDTRQPSHYISSQTLDLHRLYDSLVQQLGRNNALYRTASIAKQRGMTYTQVYEQLRYHHATYPAPASHPPETPNQRLLEAQRTIQSAFIRSSDTSVSSGAIPNSIREKLLQQQHSTILPRLLDIFSLARWKALSTFTLSEAIQLARIYGLNRKSVLRAFVGDLSQINNQYIIFRKPVEYPDIEGLNLKRRGRPVEICYQVPSVDSLLRLLKVNFSPSDYLSKDDVKSAHDYRIALHREYIKRVSPQVPMAWLAERIGVNVRTIQRYNLELDVQITQNMGHFSLTKLNLDSLPQRHRKIIKNATNGFWLETDDGQRYPAWRHIGSRLLKTHRNRVMVCVQRPSKLTLSDEKFELNTINWQTLAPTEFVRIQAFRACVDDAPKLNAVVDNLFTYVQKRVNQVRYLDYKLHFDSVVNFIAKDNVAETITSYLYAYDAEGNRVQRPAKRGIAYRMLKEFGNGNVFFALLDLHTEMFYALARHAQNFGHLPTAMKFLLSALD